MKWINWLTKVIAITWKSASWKNALLDTIKRSFPQKLEQIITLTTRPPRQWEREWVDYKFVNESEFRRLESWLIDCISINKIEDIWCWAKEKTYYYWFHYTDITKILESGSHWIIHLAPTSLYKLITNPLIWDKICWIVLECNDDDRFERMKKSRSRNEEQIHIREKEEIKFWFNEAIENLVKIWVPSYTNDWYSSLDTLASKIIYNLFNYSNS